MSKKRLLIGIKFLLSGALIWFLVQNIDLDQALTRAGGMAPEYLAAGLALLFVQLPIANWRWLIALRAMGEPLPFWKAFTFLYIGIFFNQILPSSVGGDAVRIYKSYKGGLSLPGAVNGVMLDRVATVLALILLVAVLQPLLVARIEGDTVTWVFPLLSVAAVGGVVVLMLLDRMPESIRGWKAIRGMAYLAADTRRVFLSIRWTPLAIGVSALGNINISLAVYVLARGLDIPVTAMDCIILVPPVILITTLPISIAGWGVREGAMVGAFALIGIPAESSLVLSIVFGLLAVAISLPGGLMFLFSGERTSEMDLDHLQAESKQ